MRPLIRISLVIGDRSIYVRKLQSGKYTLPYVAVEEHKVNIIDVPKAIFDKLNISTKRIIPISEYRLVLISGKVKKGTSAMTCKVDAYRPIGPFISRELHLVSIEKLRDAPVTITLNKYLKSL